jgi:heat shock protein HtpX
VDARVAALVKFAGGHDPGPLALPSDPAADQTGQPAVSAPSGHTPPPGPWSDASQSAGTPRGPWGKPVGPWDRG